MVKNVEWTDAMIERMRDMAHAGKSTREIAAALHDPDAGYVFTRNMIIGKARREGIALKVASAPHIVQRQKAPPRPAPAAAVPAISATRVREPVGKVEKVMTLEERQTYRQRERARVLDFIERTKRTKRAGGVPFMERRIGECAYLHGTGYLSLVCGEPIVKGSYCATHAALCYTATARMTGAMKPAADMSVQRVKVKPEVEEDDVDAVDAMLTEVVEIDEEAFSAL